MHPPHLFTYEFCTRFECAKATQDLSVWYASVDFAPENYKIHIYSNTNPDSRDYGRYYWSVMHKNGVSTNPSGMHYTSLSRAARAAIGTLMTLQAREEEQPDAPVPVSMSDTEQQERIYTDLEMSQAHDLASLTAVAARCGREIFSQLGTLREVKRTLASDSPEVAAELLDRVIDKLEGARLDLWSVLTS